MSKKTEQPENTIYELKEIMDILGRGHADGYCSGRHLSLILDYLRFKKTESYDLTKKKLTLKAGIGQRYLQENYLDGIEAWGIIEIFFDDSSIRHWRWVGVKALRDNGEK